MKGTSESRWSLTTYVIIFLLFGFSRLSALAPYIPVDRYLVETWRLEDGLPQNTITCIAQTRSGYIWIGTGNGLARFDGVHFQNFFFFENGRRIGQVNQLFVDRDGNLWIINIDCIGIVSDSPSSVPRSVMEKVGLTDIHQDRSGRLWLLTNNGVAIYTKEKAKFIHRDPNFFKIMEDREGGVWLFNSELSAWHFQDSGRLERVIDWSDRGWKTIFDVIEHGNDWVIATDLGFFHSNEKHHESIAFITGVPFQNSYQYCQFFLDHKQSVWIYSPEGIAHLNCPEKKWDSILPIKTNSWSNNTICIDKDLNLWIASTAGPGRISLTGTPNLEKSSRIASECLSIFEDSWGNIWGGLRYGLVRFNKPRISVFHTDPVNTCNSLRLVFLDHKGVLRAFSDACTQWFELAGNRLILDSGWKRNGSNPQVYPLINHKYFLVFPGGPIAIADDRRRVQKLNRGFQHSIERMVQNTRGECWIILSNREIIQLDPENFKLLRNIGAKIPSSTIGAMKPFPDGSIWIGTNQGLFLLKSGKITQLFPDSMISELPIVDIFRDRDGNVWLGCYGGLGLIQKDNIHIFQVADGLADPDILAIQEDDDSRLWLSTNHGIMAIEKKKLLASAEGKIKKLHPLLFDTRDGMTNIEGNSSIHSSLRDSDGRIWFCNMDGLVMIDPKNLQFHLDPPPVHIERVVADGSDKDQIHSVVAPAGTKRLEIHFTVVDFIHPNKVHFLIRLEGYDRDWLEIGGNQPRFISYTGLPPGRYRFRVRACNGDGVWNLKGATLDLRVLPFFWQTAWFRIAAALAGLAILYLLTLFIRRFFFLFTYWRKKRLVGPYVLEEIIGYGAMATVFRAHRLLSSREKVAVKILKKEHFADELTLQRFKREGALIDLIDHPHIVRVLSRGEQEGTFYIVMEHLEGITLAERISRWGRFDLPDAAPILLQLVDVLGELHRRGIIHRDLKPANIMLPEREGRFDFVKLLDFGTAKPTFQATETEYGTFVGTLAYMAPEQIRGRETTASDIYSLGMIAYEMLAGIRPFAACKPFDLPETIQEHPPDPLGGIRPDLPVGLVGLIMRTLAKDPGLRPSLNEIASELAEM